MLLGTVALVLALPGIAPAASDPAASDPAAPDPAVPDPAVPDPGAPDPAVPSAWALLGAAVPSTPPILLPVCRSSGEASRPACRSAARALELLERGLLPEAAGAARWARVLAGSNAPAIRAGSEFLRAEALRASGRVEEAAGIYRSLRDDPSPRLSRAARLRLADQAFEAGHFEAARSAYEELLPSADELGSNPAPWAVRAAEASLATGDAEAALHWLESALASSNDASIAEQIRLRTAEILATTDRSADAREGLVALAASGSDGVAALAAVRLVELDGFAAVSDLKAHLEPALRPSHPRLAAWSRLVLARGQLAANELEESLDSLTRLLVDSHAASYEAQISDTLDEVLDRTTDAAVEQDPCARQIEILGWRRDLLSRRARRPDALVLLGRCYSEFGLTSQAIELYRTVVKRFGTEGAEAVALPLARSSLAFGDLALAEVTARERLRLAEESESPERDAWRRLLAEIHLAAGRPRQALELLESFVGLGGGGGPRAEDVAMISEAIAVLPADRASRELLGVTLSNASDSERRAHPELFGRAALVAAHLHRHAGDLDRAQRLYDEAWQLLPQGPRSDQAAYWRAVTAADPGVERQRLRESAADTASTWGELARNRLQVVELLQRAGREPAPWSAPNSG